MKFMNKLERKFGKFAIQNLTVYIIATYVIGYILELAAPSILGTLALNPQAILRGEIWRLVTWVLSPPSSLNVFTIVMLICYYQLGTILERTWGAFRYNVYIFLGLIMTIVGAFIINAIPTGAILFTYADYMNISIISTYYVSLSIFLGFAMTFPEQQMLFMFIIPLKIKWLALVDIAYLAYLSIDGLLSGNWITLILILCSLAGTILYFLMSRDFGKYSRKERQRKQSFQKAMGRSQVGRGAAVHKCAVCGQTELDNPDLEFRFCSRCNGNYEYCQNHLFTHEHIR